MKSEKWKRGGPCGLFKTEVLDGDKLVATVVTRHRHGRRDPIEPRPEGADNLNLIIAAPDLLEALELLLIWANISDEAVGQSGQLRDKARAAIAKARGEKRCEYCGCVVGWHMAWCPTREEKP